MREYLKRIIELFEEKSFIISERELLLIKEALLNTKTNPSGGFANLQSQISVSVQLLKLEKFQDLKRETDKSFLAIRDVIDNITLTDLLNDLEEKANNIQTRRSYE